MGRGRKIGKRGEKRENGEKKKKKERRGGGMKYQTARRQRWLWIFSSLVASPVLSGNLYFEQALERNFMI